VVAALHALFMENLSEHNASEDFIGLWEGLSESGSDGGSWAIDYPEDES
jgi:hypothetical protein